MRTYLVVIALVVVIVIGAIVIGRSQTREERRRCESAGGVYISNGDDEAVCLKGVELVPL